MTEKEIFDPARSADIRRMLVQEAARTSRAPRQRTKRIAVIASLAVAAVVLAGGSTAWALGVRPFAAAPPAPTPTHTVAPSPTPLPTSTPTTTPTPVVTFDPPVSRVGLGCAALGAGSSLDALVPAADLSASPALPEIRYAALRETGAESCFWSGSDFHLLSLDISTNVAAGRADIAAGVAQGFGPVAVGDASSSECGEVAQGCAVSVVAGSYWLNFEYEHSSKQPKQVSPVMIAMMKSIIAKLDSHAPSGAVWAMPQTSWSTVTKCSDMHSTAALSALVGVKLSDPEALQRGAYGGIAYEVPGLLSCFWAAPSDTSIPPDGSRGISAMLATGARWGYEEATKSGGKPVTIAGADAAVMSCYTVDGEVCVLDVLSDNSWLQLNHQESIANVATQSSQLVAAAKVILAQHH
jgi:hypothetical protein